MAYWLLKTEPDCYSWPDLVRDKRTAWDGVANNAALKYMRQMKKGDEAFIYHTGDVRSAIGIAEVVKEAYPDPKEDEDRLVVIDVKAIKPLEQPVSLSDIKADKAFEGFELIRQSRLSVVPVPEAMWKRIIELSTKD